MDTFYFIAIAAINIGGLALIFERLQTMSRTQEQLAAALSTIEGVLVKARDEIVAQVAALKAALEAAGSTSPEVEAAVTRLEAVATALDDLNPDAPPADPVDPVDPPVAPV